MKQSNANGYRQVGITRPGISTRVHVLVASAFLKKDPLLPEVNHKNGDKTDNRLENLEFCDRFGNMRHASDFGLLRKGSEVKHSKLNEESARLIKEMLSCGIPVLKISKQIGISRGVIYDIKRGRIWSHVNLKKQTNT